MMKLAISKYFTLLLVGTTLLVAAGCAGSATGPRVGDLQTESETVELGDAESVRADISMGAGDLSIGGGASSLMEADFTYNVAELKPEVTYDGGNLVVKHPDVEVGLSTLLASVRDLADFRNEWDLRFNDDVPMEMSIDYGAGSADLQLDSLSLTRLDINTGAGDLNLDLSGAPSLTRLDVDIGAGSSTLDLTGEWQTNLDATIRGGVGEMTVRLPRETGVRVNLESGLGEVNAPGLTRDGDAYVNDSYGESEVTLRIDITAGVGRINLELGE